MEGEETLRMDLVRERVALARRKKRLKAELREVEASIENLHAPILDDMARENLRNIPFEDGATVVQERQFFCRRRNGTSDEALVKAAEKIDMDWLVKIGFHRSLLKTWLREQEEEHGMQSGSIAELLPPELQEFFAITEVYRTKVMGAGLEERGEHESG